MEDIKISTKKYVILVTLLLLIVGSVYGAYKVYDYTEHDPNFCASCHLMETAWKAWKAGPHNQVSCHKCHQQDVVSRTRIVWSWAMHNYEKVPPHTRLDRAVCENCHLSQDKRWKQIADTPGHKIHALRADLHCLSCHLPSLHAVEPKVEDCQKCHSHARFNIGGMKDFHCTYCHNFLAKNQDGLKPTRESCLNCHASMQVASETFPEGAPMVFQCSECHKPHSKAFLSFNDCLGCHQNIVEDRKHFEKKALTTCTSCHKPHSWTAEGWERK